MAFDIKELYWAAGFLEGEGTFHLLKRPSRSRGFDFRVTCPQVQKEPLVRLQKLFGGTFHVRKPRTEREQPCWVWNVCGARARGVALTVFSLMSEKRKTQIKKMLDVPFWNIYKARGCL